jgi:hypothetical protein
MVEGQAFLSERAMQVARDAREMSQSVSRPLKRDGHRAEVIGKILLPEQLELLLTACFSVSPARSGCYSSWITSCSIPARTSPSLLDVSSAKTDALLCSGSLKDSLSSPRSRQRRPPLRSRINPMATSEPLFSIRRTYVLDSF